MLYQELEWFKRYVQERGDLENGQVLDVNCGHAMQLMTWPSEFAKQFPAKSGKFWYKQTILGGRGGEGGKIKFCKKKYPKSSEKSKDL